MKKSCSIPCKQNIFMYARFVHLRLKNVSWMCNNLTNLHFRTSSSFLLEYSFNISLSFLYKYNKIGILSMIWIIKTEKKSNSFQLSTLILLLWSDGCNWFSSQFQQSCRQTREEKIIIYHEWDAVAAPPGDRCFEQGGGE